MDKEYGSVIYWNIKSPALNISGFYPGRLGCGHRKKGDNFKMEPDQKEVNDGQGNFSSAL